MPAVPMDTEVFLAKIDGESSRNKDFLSWKKKLSSGCDFSKCLCRYPVGLRVGDAYLPTAENFLRLIPGFGRS